MCTQADASCSRDMAARSRAPVLCLLLVSFFILLCLRSHPLGLKEIAFWMGRFILILALVTFIVSVVTPYFNAVHLSGSSPAVPQEESERHQEVVRKEQQKLLSKKASEYNENIVKPRQEEKLKKLEERFYKMTGQTWKLTEGYTLGEVEDQENDSAGPKDHVETANEEAIRKRKLPEHVTKLIPQCEQPPPKRVITLPEEPCESEEGLYVAPVVVFIKEDFTSPSALFIEDQCTTTVISSYPSKNESPLGEGSSSARVTTVRYCLWDCQVQLSITTGSPIEVLLDWMMKIGYHPVLYSVCTPMPRCLLELKENVTLESVGITRHTALNIEEKDPL